MQIFVPNIFYSEGYEGNMPSLATAGVMHSDFYALLLVAGSGLNKYTPRQKYLEIASFCAGNRCKLVQIGRKQDNLSVKIDANVNEKIKVIGDANDDVVVDKKTVHAVVSEVVPEYFLNSSSHLVVVWNIK